jgi:hypothetical protein
MDELGGAGYFAQHYIGARSANLSIDRHSLEEQRFFHRLGDAKNK